MSRERIIVLGIALSFYALGSGSIYGEYRRQEGRAGGAWRSAEAVITDAYRQDIENHELRRPKLLGYEYIVRGVSYRVHAAAAQKVLADAQSHRASVRVQYKPEDPTVAILAANSGNANYSRGLGLIGFGTLIALIRELVLRRRDSSTATPRD